MADKLEILNDLKRNLNVFLGENLKDVILFGSQMTEKSDINSDYDFLIILKNKPDWKLKHSISDICYGIDLKYDIITDTHILSEYEQNTLRGKQPIFINAMKKGIHA
jgi:predicted nucleotidyltransferase